MYTLRLRMATSGCTDGVNRGKSQARRSAVLYPPRFGAQLSAPRRTSTARAWSSVGIRQRGKAGVTEGIIPRLSLDPGDRPGSFQESFLSPAGQGVVPQSGVAGGVKVCARRRGSPGGGTRPSQFHCARPFRAGTPARVSASRLCLIARSSCATYIHFLASIGEAVPMRCRSRLSQVGYCPVAC